MGRLPYLLAHVTPRESRPYLRRAIERRATDLALLGFLGVTLPEDGPEKVPLPERKEDVVIGGFCGRSCVKECTALFGENLWQACRTCPN